MSPAVVVETACRVCGEEAADGKGLACQPCIAAVSGLRGRLRDHHLSYLTSCRQRLAERVLDGERKIERLPADAEARPALFAKWRGLLDRYERLCLVVPE
jgi:hypothetical protein